MDKTSKIWISFFLMALAALLLFAAYDSLWNFVRTQDWVEKDAVIVMSRLESGNGVHLDLTARLADMDRDIPVQVLYGVFMSQKDYREQAKKYPSGKKVILFQNPDNPEEIVLERSNEPNPYAYLWAILGIGLVLLQLVLILRWGSGPKRH